MKTFRIFCNASLDAVAMKLLKESVNPHVLLESGSALLSEADVAFGQPNPTEALQSTSLKWIHLNSAGYTRYDTSAFREGAGKIGLQLTNSSSVYDSPCAEQLFSFMMAQSRGLVEALQTRTTNGGPVWAKLRYTCRTLTGQSVLILGFGAIARRLVELLAPFHMKITAYRRTPTGDEGLPMVTTEGLPAALAAADHVINILPENTGTISFFSAERLGQIKPGAIFYNIGRGTTVDQQALAEALNSGRLGAAWLDVTDPEPLPEEHPLWKISNCHITPHIGGGRHEEGEALVNHFLQNLERYAHEKNLQDRVI
jgi:phosphoglycerate dehydrogenase-like enzyme